MNTQSLANWVQILTGVAVVIGIALVIWELQQAREIARFEQQNAGFAQFSQHLQSQMGENAASAVAKACDDPDGLTTEEMFILDRYYLDVLNNMRAPLLASMVSEDLTTFGWERWVGNFSTIFATEYGRWWFETSNWEPEIMEAGREYLANREIGSCADRYNRYRNRSRSSQSK